MDEKLKGKRIKEVIMKVLEEKIGYTVEMPPAINCDIKAITERMKKNATKPAKVRDMPDPEGLQ